MGSGEKAPHPLGRTNQLETKDTTNAYLGEKSQAKLKLLMLRMRIPQELKSGDLENQDGGVGRHTAPPRTTRTDRESNSKGD